MIFFLLLDLILGGRCNSFSTCAADNLVGSPALVSSSPSSSSPLSSYVFLPLIDFFFFHLFFFFCTAFLTLLRPFGPSFSFLSLRPVRAVGNVLLELVLLFLLLDSACREAPGFSTSLLKENLSGEVKTPQHSGCLLALLVLSGRSSTSPN